MAPSQPSLRRVLPLTLLAALSGDCATRRAPPVVAVARDPYPSGDRAAVVHLLERFAFGPRPGDVERVQRVGIGAWLDEQLHPDRLADAPGRAALAPYVDALRTPGALYAEFDARELERMQSPDGAMPAAPMDLPASATFAVPTCRDGADPPDRDCLLRARRADRRELLGMMQMTVLARHIASERQLVEVMTDFWTNHFNVFAQKGPVRFLAADYVERAIRPNALGRFEDLLLATAHHPAMLVYLDNWRSVAPRPEFPGRPGRGLNENYARELLELHTLGVDGGYTQHDVTEVARVLTGWSMTPEEDGDFRFRFRPAMHDGGEKTVLGMRFPAGGGQDEGERLLRMLARHPSTARFVARKLVERFVADEPPPALVDAVARTYRETDGDVRAMLLTIARSREFWAPEYRGNKVKTPLEFVASAVRALGGGADGTDGLARVVARLGEPLWMNPVPTGYPDDASRWMNSAAALDRMNLSVALARGTLQGAALDLDARWPAEPAAGWARRVGDDVLLGQGSTHTLAVIAQALAGGLGPRQARTLAVALALASPEFQRQ